MSETMTDEISKLRADRGRYEAESRRVFNLNCQQANELAKLRAENERLRAIIETLREHVGKLVQCIPAPPSPEMR